MVALVNVFFFPFEKAGLLLLSAKSFPKSFEGEKSLESGSILTLSTKGMQLQQLKKRCLKRKNKNNKSTQRSASLFRDVYCHAFKCVQE